MEGKGRDMILVRGCENGLDRDRATDCKFLYL